MPSVVLEGRPERFSLLVPDGGSFRELARTPLPHLVPADTHGQFLTRPHGDGDGPGPPYGHLVRAG